MAEEDILRGDRRTVGKARLLAQMEADGAAVLGHLDAFGNQAIERERFVTAARHQALVDVLAQVSRSDSLDNKRIEAIEGAERA